MKKKYYNARQGLDSHGCNAKTPCIKRNLHYVKFVINSQLLKQSKLVRNVSKLEFNKNA